MYIILIAYSYTEWCIAFSDVNMTVELIILTNRRHVPCKLACSSLAQWAKPSASEMATVLFLIS